MSDVMIFKATSDNYFLKGPDFEYFYKAKPDEKFVKLEDYARLNAENEQLTKMVESSQYYFLSIKLTAENAQLRKAGDWMREALEEGPIDYQCRIDRWNAAKEGNPSV